MDRIRGRHKLSLANGSILGGVVFSDAWRPSAGTLSPRVAAGRHRGGPGTLRRTRHTAL